MTHRAPHFVFVLTLALAHLGCSSGGGDPHPAVDTSVSDSVHHDVTGGGATATDTGTSTPTDTAAADTVAVDGAAGPASDTAPTEPAADVAGSQTGTDATTDNDSGPGDQVTDDVAIAPPPELHGEVPASALPAPEFTVLADDGTTRTRPDLLGNPTVMWFFPLSGTPG